MSGRHFNYFDDWKDEILECPKCQWSGTFEQGSVEHYMEEMNVACPKCDAPQAPILAVVLYPTLEDLRANADWPGVREWLEAIDRGFDEFEKLKLREPSQLPDILESSFDLVWDFEADSNGCRTLIRHGEVVVFSEPARYGGFRRFGEVCEILRARYGDKIKDLVPAMRSEDWLFGNAREAKNFVEWFRLHHFGATVAKQQRACSAMEFLLRNPSFYESATQQTAQDDSQAQLALDFETTSGPSDERQPSEDTSKVHGTRRPVPGVPGATSERTEYGTSLILQPNSEFDSLPSEQRTEIIRRMLKCMDAPDHNHRVTALRDEFANGLANNTQRPPDDWPSAYASFHFGLELPDIADEEFSLVFDYSNDGSKYFVLYGEQIILSGPATNDPEDYVTDNALGEQFIGIAKTLKKQYGASLVDLFPTQKAENMLMDIWGWACKLDRGRKIVQQRECTD